MLINIQSFIPFKGGYQLKCDDMAQCYTSKHTQLVNEIQNQP